MKLKLSLLFIIFISFFSLSAKPIILWDIHGVLIEPQDRVIALFKFPHLKQAVTRFSWPFFKDLTRLLYDNASQELTSEEYVYLALKHANPYLAELTVQIANSQKPIPGMKELVNELHDLGYEQHIGSNIGFISFHRLLNPKKYPQIAPLLRHMNISRSVVVDNDNGTFIKKPDPHFFKKYLNKNRIDLQKTSIIFIDDKPKNIYVARRLGLDGIRFKNPRQLRTELRKRNIPVKGSKNRYASQQSSHALYNRSSFFKPMKLKSLGSAS